jgi:hypothetical protein
VPVFELCKLGEDVLRISFQCLAYEFGLGSPGIVRGLGNHATNQFGKAAIVPSG